MRITSQLLAILGIAIPGSTPEMNDTDIHIPNTILPVTEPIFPTYRMVGAGGTSETSINVAVQVNVVNASAGQNTLCTFTAGLYEIDLQLDVASNFTQPAGTSPFTTVALYQPDGSNANPLLSAYARNGVYSHGRKLRFLFAKDGWVLKLLYSATGVGQNLDQVVDAQITHIL